MTAVARLRRRPTRLPAFRMIADVARGAGRRIEFRGRVKRWLAVALIGLTASPVAAQITAFPEHVQGFHKDCLLKMLRGRMPRPTAESGLRTFDTGRTVGCETRGSLPKGHAAGPVVNGYHKALLGTGLFWDASACVDSNLPIWGSLISKKTHFNGRRLNVGVVHYGRHVMWLIVQERLASYEIDPNCVRMEASDAGEKMKGGFG